MSPAQRLFPARIRCVFVYLCLVVAPTAAFAQAGSRPALLFDSNASFYHSVAGIKAAGSGPGTTRAISPKGAWMLSDATRYLLWVELGKGQLNVLEKVGPDSLVLRKRIPVSIGKKGFGKLREGDQKTPIGVYRLTGFLRDAQLDDFYGLGAFPLNYPNPEDRLAGKTGHGIWLHGLPKNIGERPLLDSDGCVVVDNDSLTGLRENIVAGQTAIVMSPRAIDWVPAAYQRQARAGLARAIDAWKAAWEARDNQAYLAYYADDFSDLYRDKAQWAAYKTRVNNSKRSIHLEFSRMSMLVDPLQDGRVTVRYYQDYDSNNYHWSGWKEQIWRELPQGWRIVYEGNG